MRRVRQKDTRPEMIVRQLVHRLGFRFRLHRRDLPGTPDIVLPKYRSVIFVHGCFWHGHSCKKGALPTTRVDFWRDKFARNRIRDSNAAKELSELGYKVLVIWECQTSDHDFLSDRVKQFLTGNIDDASKNCSRESSKPSN